MKNLTKLRLALSTTALASGLLFVATPAWAQNLPDTGHVTNVNAGLGGTVPAATTPVFTPTPTPTGTNLQVDLRNNRTVLNWSGTGFNIGGGYSVNFKDARATSGVTGRTDNIAVLNRDLTGQASAIFGNLTSDANVAVYVISRGGIYILPEARIDTGSFLASTVDLADESQFLGGSGTLRFNNSLQGEVALAGGAQIRTHASASSDGGRMGDVVLIGDQIVLNNNNGNSSINAGGDVALIGGQDVTMQASPGSPLSFTITSGSSYFGSAAVTVRGDITGRNITLATGSKGPYGGNGTGNGIKLDAGSALVATGAAQSDRGIVLSAGREIDGVSYGTAFQAPIIPGVYVDPGMTAFQSAKGILIASASDVQLGSALNATGKIDIRGGLIKSQALTGSDVAFTGTRVTLQNTVTSTVGDISFADGIELIANGDLTAARDIYAPSLASIVGTGKFSASRDITIKAGSILLTGNGGIDAGLTGTVTLQDLGTGVSSQFNMKVVGDIRGRTVTITSPRFIDLGWVRSGDGVVSITSDYAMNVFGIHGLSVLLTALGIPSGPESGNITISTASSTTSSPGNIVVNAAGNFNVTNSIQPGLMLYVRAGGSANLGQVFAGRDVDVAANGITASWIETGIGSLLRLDGRNGAVTLSGAINAGGSVDITGRSVTVPNISITGSRLSLVSTAGEVKTANLTSTFGDIIVTANSGQAKIWGNVSSGGQLLVTGDGVDLRGAAAGAWSHSAASRMQIDGRAGDVTAAAGGTLQSNSDGVINNFGDPDESLVIQTSGAVNLADTTLLGGTARQADVKIRSGASQALVIGAVSARSLMGAHGADSFTDGLTSTSSITVNGDITLTNGLALTGSTVNFRNITVSNGDILVRTSAPITLNTVLNASRGVTLRTSSGDLTIGASGRLIGHDIALATPAAFKNLAGLDAIVTTGSGGHWVIYSNKPSVDTFGGLASNNKAYWNASYDSLAPGSLTGNRFVFQYQPIMQYEILSQVAKTYGVDLTHAGFGDLVTSYSVGYSGYSETSIGGLAGAYTTPGFEDLQGLPSLSSAGLDPRATVAGGPYPITLGVGTLHNDYGYGYAFLNNRSLVVNPAQLTGTVNANSKTYDGTRDATGSVSLNGILFNDDVSTTGSVFAFADKNAGTGKTVTASGTTLSGAAAGNYTLGSVAGGLADILKKALTGTLTADSKTYDGTANATGSIALSGVISGDSVGTAGSVFTFANKNAGTGKTVTATGTSLSGTDAGNYTLGVGTGLADILKKALTGTVTANSKTYDGTADASGSIGLSGVVGGDDVGTTGTVLAFADKNAGTGKTVTATGTTLSGADAGNYTLSVGTGLADILKKALTGTITANSKTYDGTRAGSGSVALSGVVSGDSVGTTGAVFTFADKNAGTGKAVTVGGTTLSGADAGNYSLNVGNSATADILKKALTGAITANNKTYDGTANATGSIALSGVVSGDDVVTSGTVLAFANKNAGTGKTVTATGTTLSGADAGNYTLSVDTGLADILKKALTGTYTVDTRTYDGTTAATGSVLLNGLVAGDSVGTTGVSFAFADKNAGLGKLVNVTGTASLTGADAGNYSFTPPSGSTATGDILKRAVTGTVTANSKTYDGTTSATGTVTISGGIAGDDVSAANLVLSFADKNAGTGKTVNVAGTLSGADAGNYTLGGLTGLADILKKALTGSVTANSKTYDGTGTTTGSIALSGIISGDSVGTTGSVFTFADKNAGTGKAVTVTGTALNGADGENYTLNLAGGATADILKKALTGAVIANSRTYDGTTGATGSVALTGVVSGDSIGTTGSVFSFADKNAGTGKTVTATGTALSGADAGNYTLGGVASGLADILKKTLTGTVTANSKTYDGTTNATGSVSVSGVLAGDDVSTSNLVLGFADKNAGTGKTVNVAGTLSGTDAGNYTLSGLTGLADILKKALTGTLTADSKTYDGTANATGSIALSGVISGDSVGTIGSVFTFANKNAGTGKTVTATGTTLSGTDAGNYTLSVGTGLADILKKALTGTVTANSKTYDGTAGATGSVSVSGVIAGDDVSAANFVLSFSDKNAGTAKNVTVAGTISGADAGNYTLAGLSGSADILKKALTGTITANSKTYDGTRTGSGSVALSGVVSGDSVDTTGSIFTFADKNAGTGKAVAVGGTTLSGTDAGNYTLNIGSSATADILKKALTGVAAVNGKTYDGTTAATGTVTLSGVVSGDTVGTSGSTFAFADKNAGTGKTVSVTGTALTGTDAANYTLSAITAIGDIFKKAISGSITANNKTYDGTTAGSGTVSLTGVIAGDSVGTTGSVFTFANKNAGTGKTVTVTGTTLNGVDSGNYSLSLPASALADILRKSITGSITVASRQYDGTTAGTGTIALNGVVSGDTVGTTGTVFTFSDKNAGAGKAVTVTGTALNGADAGNYTLTPLPGTALGEILKRVVAVAADDKSKTDGADDPLLTFTITSGSLVSGDAFSGLLTRAAGENPGSYAISIGTLSAGGNYQLNFTPGLFTIEINPATQVQQTLKAIPLPSQIQGQQPPASTVTIDKDALCGEDTACAAQ